jgi:hypothetical protein
LVPTRGVKGLPFVFGPPAQIKAAEAEALRMASRRIRTHMEACGGGKGELDAVALRKALTEDPKLSGPEAVPALLQMLQPEDAAVRMILIDMLARIDDKRSTEALAMRAMVDLSPDAREAACRRLLTRPREDYRHLLLAGLEYPWHPIRCHAAEALVFLKDKDAVPDMVAILDKPQATAPILVGKKKTPVVRELVRVNHLSNCKLCHPASGRVGNPVPGAVPNPSQPLPAPVTTPAYYERGGDFVRADVTFLRQDFSLPQKVPNHGAWPERQRFDFMVRLTPVPAGLAKPPLDKFQPRDFWKNTRFVTSKNPDLREHFMGKANAGMPEFTHEQTIRALRELTGKAWEPSQWKKYTPARAVVARPKPSRDWGQFMGQVEPPEFLISVEKK